MNLSTPCIPALRALDRNGYARLTIAGKSGFYAHRVAFEEAYGPIPAGMHVGHACHDADLTCAGGRCPHRACINPQHLVAQTPAENSRAGATGRRTHCVHGHAFDKENTYVNSGRRYCRKCQRVTKVVPWAARKRHKQLDPEWMSIEEYAHHAGINRATAYRHATTCGVVPGGFPVATVNGRLRVSRVLFAYPDAA